MPRRMEFFHGTTHDFDRVLPSSETGISNWGEGPNGAGQNATQWAHASTDEDVAWMFAHDGAGVGRARVYRVEPEGPVKKGVEVENDEYVAKSFKVKDRIDTRPGRQGTFPQLNWHQFSAFPPEQHEDGTFTHAMTDVNHPTDWEIENPGWHKGTKTPAEPEGPKVDPHQIDLFTGRTKHEEDNDWEFQLMEPVREPVTAKMGKRPLRPKTR